MTHGFSSQYRLGPVLKSGRIILNKREDTLSNLFETDKKTYKIFLILINVQNEKYWINCFCKPHNCMMTNHLATLSKFLHSDLHPSKYEKMMILGDFNVRIDKPQSVKCYR